MTVFPFWAWCFPLVFTPILFIRHSFFKNFGLLLVLWAVLSAMAGEEVVNLFRGREKNPNVATLNCAGGSKEAAREAFLSGAKILLLSETPGQASLDELIQEEWDGDGEALSGPDGAIVVRGQIEEGTEKSLINATMATVNVDGQRWNVVALRLQPPVFRVDFFTPAYWQTYQDNFDRRRDEFIELRKEIDNHFGQEKADIIAGDFNAPLPQKMEPYIWPYKEAVRKSGGGWTGSAVNEYPFVRIDHIWINSNVEAEGGRVDKTKNSDHRMVLARLTKQPGS